MRNWTLNTGASLLALAVVACAAGAVAGEATTRPVVKPVSGSVLKDTPSAYGASGAQGVYMGEAKAPVVSPSARPGDCPAGAVAGDHPDLPASVVKEARPNQCYTRLMKAPVLEAYTEREIVRPERFETYTVDEKWRWAERQVVDKPAHVRREVIKPVTRTVVEDRVVQEGYWSEEPVPPVYEKRVESVMVRPARQEWVRSEGIATGAALVTPGDHQPVRYRADGMLTWPGKDPVVIQGGPETTEYLQKGSAQTVWCLKEVPAEYRRVERLVEVAPATVRRVWVKPKIEKVERVIIEREGKVIEEPVAATYRTEKYKEILSPARTETRRIEPEYRNVEKTRVVKAPEPVWREVLCERNTTPDKVKAIQAALKQRGYDPGPVDGTLGTKTVAAMQKFQADQGLPQGQISVEAAEALGVKIH
ncbi:peptidoglycan-binding domain-containing protein [Asticcacaulis sp.]|jgi:hypothetical protein|uniref:peptidoglycan-binding domain-containing protein n=1 Tax=Asticcacaulis sp. TaxID=1872648 RepID=UPI0031E491F5